MSVQGQGGMSKMSVEYANSVGHPIRKGKLTILKKIHKGATKLVISLKHLSYKDRLVY